MYLDLVSLQSLPLFCLFLWGNLTPLSLSVVCGLKLFLLLCHPLQRKPSLELCLFYLYPDWPAEGGRTVLWLFWKLVSNFLISEFWLKGWVSAGALYLEKYRAARLSSSWVNYECCLLVFNIEFVKISHELAVTLGFPTSLPPTDNSQLSSFQRFLSYHQALSPATELVLFPVVITTLKQSLLEVSAIA